MQEQVCKSCGNNFTGNFCNNCGEKLYTEHDKTLSHISEESFHFITHLDNKFLKSLRLIFFRPGFLAAEFCRGVRKKYFKPISLFFIVVIMYLLMPLSPGLNMKLVDGANTFKFFGFPIVERMAVKKAEKKQISLQALSAKYDEKSPKVAKILLLIILPLAAGALYMLFKKKNGFYFDHFILSTEITTQFIALLFLLIPAVLKLFSYIVSKISGNDIYYNDSFMGPLAMIVLVGSWTIAFARFYKVSKTHAFFKSLLFLLLFFFITFFIYRFILFFIVLLFI